MSTYRFERHSAGNYTMRLDDTYYADIVYNTRHDGCAYTGWVVISGWDSARMSDPLPTLREAKASAIYMLNTRNDF